MRLRISNCALAAGWLAVVAATPASANVAWSKYGFTYKSTIIGKPDADALFIVAVGGRFTDNKGTTTRLGNGKINDAGTELSYSSTGNTVPDGKTETVTCKLSNEKTRLGGIFQSGGQTASLVAEGSGLSFDEAPPVPNGTGFNVMLSLLNPMSGNITGSVSVYVNSGFTTDFTADGFDVLRSASLLYSNSNFSLHPREMLTELNVQTNSLDEYVLMIGMVDAGDGTGPHEFSVGVAVPAPGCALLMGVGALAARRRR